MPVARMAVPPADSPPHRRPALITIVAIGGAVGTAAREVLSLTIPDAVGLPLGIAVINVVGAFVLGALLEALARRGPDEGGRRVARLLAGTGFCGGFTTYSTLAVGTALLLRDGATAGAVVYAGGTLVVGAVASVAGVAVGAATSRRHAQ